MGGQCNTAALVEAGRESTAKYRASTRTAQLVAASESLLRSLKSLLPLASSPAQKAAAGIYIEAFSAAFNSLQGAHSDPVKLKVALQVAQNSLQGLRSVRPVLKGRLFEVEVQHYGLVRKLVALKAFPEAAVEGWQLLDSLCQLWTMPPDTSAPSSSAVTSRSISCPVLPAPQAVGSSDLAKQAAPMVVGTLLNLLLSTVGTGQINQQHNELLKLSRLSCPLSCWLRLLTKSEAERHRDSLFRCWYKAGVSLAEHCEDDMQEDSKLEIFKCVLYSCRSCSSAARLHQIAAKLGQAMSFRALMHLIEDCLVYDIGSPVSLTMALSLVDILAGRVQNAADNRALQQFICNIIDRRPAYRMGALYAAGAACKAEAKYPHCDAWLSALQGAVGQMEELSAAASRGLQQVDMDLFQGVFRAVSYLRKAVDPSSTYQAVGARGSHIIASALHKSAELLQVAAQCESDVGSKHAYAAASALVLAAEIRVWMCVDASGDATELLSTAAQLSWFWSSASNKSGGWLKPSELQWVSSVLYNLGTQLAAAGLDLLALALLKAAVGSALACYSVAQEDNPGPESIAIICIAASKCAAGAEGWEAAVQVCTGYLEQLTRLTTVKGAHVRPVLQFLLTAGPDPLTSAPVAAAALCQLEVPRDVLGIILEEAVKVLHEAKNTSGMNVEIGNLQSAALFQKLQNEIYPATSHLLEHARVLFLQAAVSFGKEESTEVLRSAIGLLQSADSDSAAWMLADLHALLALQLAQQSFATSGGSLEGERPGADEASMEVLGSATAACDWESVHGHVKIACAAWEEALAAHTSEAVQDKSRKFASIHLATELAALAGIHGRLEQQKLAMSIAAKASDAADCPSTAKEACCPLCHALGMVDLTIGDIAADAGMLRVQAHRLAAGGNHDNAGITERAELHHAAAESFKRSGNIPSALYDASEALRLAGSLYASTSHAGSLALLNATQRTSPTAGIWQIRSIYLTCLAQVGELWEMLGSSKDALQALEEGLELALALGSSQFATLFSARLANVHVKSGKYRESAEVIAAAQANATPTAGQMSVCQQLLAAGTQLVEAESLHMQNNYFLASERLSEAGEQVLAVASLDIQSSIGKGSRQSKPSRKDQKRSTKLVADGGGNPSWLAAKLLCQIRMADAECHLGRGDVASAEHLLNAAAEALDSHDKAKAANRATDGSKPSGLPALQELHPVERASLKVVQTRLEFQRYAEASASCKPESVVLWGTERHPNSNKSASQCSRSRSRLSTTDSEQGDIGASVRNGEASGRVMLEQHLLSLVPFYKAAQHVPLLFRELGLLLANISSLLSLTAAAALFQHFTLGAGLRAHFQAGREIKQGTIEKQQAKAQLDGGCSGEASKELEGPDLPSIGLGDCSTCQDLEVQAKAQLTALVSAIPADAAVCSISACQSVWWLPNSPKDCVLITRILGAQAPLMLRLKCPQHSDAETEGAEQLATTLASILEDSAESMRSEVPKESAEQRQMWWRQRISLDLRMAALLKELDASLLGPWRCLLVGEPQDATTRHQLDAVAQAAAAKLDNLASLSGAQQVDAGELEPEVKALLGSVVQASNLLSDAELSQAVQTISLMATKECSPAEALELASAIRKQSNPSSCSLDSGPEGFCMRDNQMLLDISNASSSAANGDATATRPKRRSRRQLGSAVAAEVPHRSLLAKCIRSRRNADAVADEQIPEIEQLRAARKASNRLADAKPEQPLLLSSSGTVGQSLVGEAIPEHEDPTLLRDQQSAMAVGSKQVVAAGGKGHESVRRSTRRTRLNATEKKGSVLPGAVQQATGTVASTPAAKSVAGHDNQSPVVAAPPTRTARRAGIMSRMQSAAKHDPAAAAKGAEEKRSLLAKSSKALDFSLEGDHVSEADSDEAVKDDVFILHRGDATELGELASRMRGMALEETEAPGFPKGDLPDPGKGTRRNPVLLVLDSTLQCLPWEGIPGLACQRIYRAPSLSCAAFTADRLANPEPPLDSAEEQCPTVDMASTIYMLNPSGDLPTTEATFAAFFAKQSSWQGTVGQPMPAQEFAAALQERDMFVYCGHGSAVQYLSARLLRQLPTCSAALLMGCSSGCLATQGQYEAYGPVLAYLQAGCPAAVANLWDVTDRDIDRFSRAVLDRWTAGVNTEDQGSSACMAAAVAANRRICRLPHLIGCAPVCYGLPTNVKQPV